LSSLALPLSGWEKPAVGHDVPASAKAYEFYLRANALSQESGSWEIARDLYLQSLQADPHYAPAWARLGRVYHVIGKYALGAPAAGMRDVAKENYVHAEAAFSRALALNPELSIADRCYGRLELDLGRTQEAMVRLVRRASSRSNDPDLFVALVSACRYCGPLQSSLAAHERARRLDPNVRTGFQFTFFLIGDYLRAAAESELTLGGTVASLALACAGHPDAAKVSEAEAALAANTNFRNPVLWMYEPGPDRSLLRSAVEDLIASGLRDPEGLFHLALKLAHAGDADRASLARLSLPGWS
jgi:tetratricopeptide (TPR) repeat protein